MSIVRDAGDTTADQFARHDYAVLRGLIDRPLIDFFWSYAHTKFASLTMKPGDRQLPNTPAGYGDPTFDGLLEHLRPQIEGFSGHDLHPTYSYFRLYRRGDVLKRHRDRPACEISVSLNIGQVPDGTWPLRVEGRTGIADAKLGPGDGLLYRGVDCFHWREPFDGERLVQVFLHYVDREGPHAAEKFDRRPGLMRPKPAANKNEDQAVDD